MILTHELRGAIAKKGLTQAKLAHILEITPDTFYRKMEKGVFKSDEIEKMIEVLGIDDPVPIFFAPSVTYDVT